MPRTFVWHPGRGPARTPKEELTSGLVQIRQVRSGIGNDWRMRQTLEAIGLRHHQDVVVKQDSPSLRGQIRRVRHLVEVTPVAEGTERTATQRGTPREKKTNG
jgi:large subunit ribosomal protein L30